MDAAFDFAKYTLSAKYEDIPAEIVEITKKGILDTLGDAVAASTAAPKCRELVELVKDGGGKAESTVVVSGLQCLPLLPLPNGWAE